MRKWKNICFTLQILRTLESYDGVKEVKDFIGTRRIYYQDRLTEEIDKRVGQKHIHQQ